MSAVVSCDNTLPTILSTPESLLASAGGSTIDVVNESRPAMNTDSMSGATLVPKMFACPIEGAEAELSDPLEMEMETLRAEYAKLSKQTFELEKAAAQRAAANTVLSTLKSEMMQQVSEHEEQMAEVCSKMLRPPGTDSNVVSLHCELREYRGNCERRSAELAFEVMQLRQVLQEQDKHIKQLSAKVEDLVHKESLRSSEFDALKKWFWQEGHCPVKP